MSESVALRINPVTGLPVFPANAQLVPSTSGVVWVSKSGDDATGVRGRFDRPFLTVGAAESAAQSGDAVCVLPGDYGEEILGGKDEVFYHIFPGALGPRLHVQTAITIRGKGICRGLLCNHAGAQMLMPDMDAAEYIECGAGVQVARNSGESITCFGGTQTAGNAAAQVACQEGGVQRVGNVGAGALLISGTQEVKDVAGNIQCQAGVQRVRTAGERIICMGGSLTVETAKSAITGANFLDAPITLDGDASLRVLSGVLASTVEGADVVRIGQAWSGTLRLENVALEALDETSEDESTHGIRFLGTVTGKTILKNVSFRTKQHGIGQANSVKSDEAVTVYAQGGPYSTHAADANVIFAGTSEVVNANF